MGKTYFFSQLIKELKRAGKPVRAVKPVCSGIEPAHWAQSDPGRLLQAMGQAVTPERIHDICPWQYKAPLTPSMAAALEDKRVELSQVVEYCQNQAKMYPLTIAEGVGGIMAPLSETQTVLDWIQALRWPCILVVGTYLGSISHTLTALKTLQSAGCGVALVVVNETPESTVPLMSTLQSLKPFVQDVPLMPLRWKEGLDSLALKRIIFEADEVITRESFYV